MTEFSEVIKQFKRMCRYYNGQKCGGCPLYCKGHGCNISHCRMLAFEDKKFANVVTAWAAEHPESVYPTWVEWLRQTGVVPHDQMCFHAWLLTPIPADIAQKLGIKPKEET